MIDERQNAENRRMATKGHIRRTGQDERMKKGLLCHRFTQIDTDAESRL
jgi:hypothetical protein